MNEILNAWRVRHGVSTAAIDDLRQLLTAVTLTHVGTRHSAPNSETRVQDEARLLAAKHNQILWRNNVGALKDERGIPVRYGLANDSKEINKIIKSADLIGIRRMLVTPAMVGTVVGQFVSYECKHRHWTPGEKSAHESAQYAWVDLVNAWGGRAMLIADPAAVVI